MQYNQTDVPRVAIVTTTYNMGDTILDTYASIKCQTYPNLYWLVVDNGSTDDTKLKIEQAAAEQCVEIVYHYKEHGVRATAINCAYDLVKEEYIGFIDADDRYSENAVGIFMGVWLGMPEHTRASYWCVLGNCQNLTTGETVGKPFPSNANEGNRYIKIAFDGSYGEKLGMQRRAAIGEARLPTFEGEEIDYISEAILWQYLSLHYKQFFINDIVRIYHINPKSYTAQRLSWRRANSQLASAAYSLNHIMCIPRAPLKQRVKEAIRVGMYGYLCGLRAKELCARVTRRADKMLVGLCFPASICYTHIKFKNELRDEIV